MIHNELILTTPYERRHADAIFDLAGKVFAHEGYAWTRIACLALPRASPRPLCSPS